MKDFGVVIREARKAKRLTLEAVAKKIGSHKGYVSGIENRKVNPPSPRITKRLCASLGLGVEDMLIRAWIQKAPVQVREILIARLALS